MKILGTFLAIALLLGILVGLGYGGMLLYQLLAAEWQVLTDQSRAVFVLATALVIFCTLFLSVSIRGSLRRYALKGTGRVMVYNDFACWYSALKDGSIEAMQTEHVRELINRMNLWGSRQVAKQARKLYESARHGEADRELILKKAEHVYIEIKRELGIRGSSADTVIV